MLLDNKWW